MARLLSIFSILLLIIVADEFLEKAIASGNGLNKMYFSGVQQNLKLTAIQKNVLININSVSSQGIQLLSDSLASLVKAGLRINKIITEADTFNAGSEKVILPDNVKMLKIYFSHIDSFGKNNLKCEYKLEPFDNEWQQSGLDKMARYTNLPYGDYRFELRMFDNSKNEEIAEVEQKIRIKPSFFETLTFKIIVIILLLWFLWMLYIIRVSTLKRQNNVLQDHVYECDTEISKQKEALQNSIRENEKLQTEIDLKNEEILIATNKMEHAYLNLELLSEIGTEITSYLNIDLITTLVYRNVNTMMDSDIFGIGTYDPVNSQVNFATAYYKGQKLNNVHTGEGRDKCLLCFSAEHEQEIISNDIQNEYPQFTQTFPKISPLMNVSSAITIPLKSKGKLVGMLTVQSFRKNSYSEYHFNLLKSLAVYIGIAMDNTNTYEKLNEQKLELQEVNSSKDKLFSIIGHDLRNPLGTIKLFLDFLVEHPEKANSGDIHNILKTMQQSLGSTYTLLDNLFMWAKSQRGQIEFNPEPFDIEFPISECLSLVSETCRIKGICISSQNECKDQVYADKIMITTVLRNLIGNAVKFTPTGGKITVKVTKKLQKFANGLNELVDVQVIDNGIGISDQDIERILNPKSLYTTQGTGSEKGSGLGISICLDFLKRHQKELIIEGNNGTDGRPETGATFKFFLDKA